SSTNGLINQFKAWR
ncbi:Glucose-6-phosphate isomerase, partial [Haemophilus influenzae]